MSDFLSRGLNRRGFAQRVVAGTLASVPLVGCAGSPMGNQHLAAADGPSSQTDANSAGQQSPVEAQKKDDDSPQIDDAGQAQSAKPKSAAELILELIVQRYPQNLENEHLEKLLGEIEGDLARSAVLNAFPLTNADSPASVFAAYRNDTDRP